MIREMLRSGLGARHAQFMGSLIRCVLVCVVEGGWMENLRIRKHGNKHLIVDL